MVSQNVNVRKDTERLSKHPRLQEVENTWQLNAIPDSSPNTVLEGKKMLQKTLLNQLKKMKYGNRLKY